MPHFSVDVSARLRQARGDAACLGSLLEQYRGFLWLMAQQKLGGRLAARCDASDVVQQTLLEAAKGFAKFTGTSEPEFSAWIKHIHLQNVRDVMRGNVTAQNRSVRRETPLLDPEGSASFFWHEPAADQTTPSQRVIRAENALRLAGLLQDLPPDQRETVRLRHIEGWPLARIARHMDRSVVATAGLLKRGLQALRTKMSKESWT